MFLVPLAVSPGEGGDLLQLTRSVKNPLANIMSRGYRAELTMAILIPVFQQFTGAILTCLVRTFCTNRATRA